MDKDRIKGAAQKIKGGVEKVVGKLIGNKKMVGNGKIDEAVGSARAAVGEAKDTIRNSGKNQQK